MTSRVALSASSPLASHAAHPSSSSSSSSSPSSSMGESLMNESDEVLRAEAQHEEDVIDKIDEQEEKILAPLLRDTSPEARAARKRFMLRAVAGELVGSTLLFYMATALSVHTHRIRPTDAAASTLVNGVGSTLLVIPLVYSFADISGAHFNPALTFACWVTKKTSNRKCILYILAQLLGSCVAMLLLWASFPEGTQMFVDVAILPQVDDKGRVFAMEFLATFILVFVIFALVFDEVETSKRETMTFRGVANSRGLTVYAATPQSKTGFVPIAIGMLIGALTCYTGTVSSGGFNPARMFGPALFGGVWTELWLYWLAQLSGGVMGALARTAFGVFGVPKDKKKVGVAVAPLPVQQLHHRERRDSDVEVPLHRHD